MCSGRDVKARDELGIDSVWPRLQLELTKDFMSVVSPVVLSLTPMFIELGLLEREDSVEGSDGVGEREPEISGNRKVCWYWPLQLEWQRHWGDLRWSSHD